MIYSALSERNRVVVLVLLVCLFDVINQKCRKTLFRIYHFQNNFYACFNNYFFIQSEKA
jgi:hypothetical protein